MKTIIFSTLILLTVTGCAPRLPEGELARSRERLEHYLMNNAMTQSEMTILSHLTHFQLQAKFRKDHFFSPEMQYSVNM